MSQSMFESLESRKLLASTWALASGTLTITGTSGNLSHTATVTLQIKRK